MCPSAEPQPAVALELLNVTEDVLELLLLVALSDARAGDVTPPLGDTTEWTKERIEWFRRYHRASRPGLSGPAQQKTWAISVRGRPVGAVRLKRTTPDTAETGIWLGRSARGQGLGVKALRLVLTEARSAELRQVVARTTRANSGAQRILTQCGGRLAFDGDMVTAVVVLAP